MSAYIRGLKAVKAAHEVDQGISQGASGHLPSGAPSAQNVGRVAGQFLTSHTQEGQNQAANRNATHDAQMVQQNQEMGNKQFYKDYFDDRKF